MTDAETIETMRRLAVDGRLVDTMRHMPWTQRREWFAVADRSQVFSDREVADACAVLDADPRAELPVDPQQAPMMTTRQRHEYLSALRRAWIRSARLAEREFWANPDATIPPHGVWGWPDSIVGGAEDELRRASGE